MKTFSTRPIAASPMARELDELVSRLEEISGGPSERCTDDHSDEWIKVEP